MRKIGEYSVSVVETHRFRLDGGAMFGAVPKALWQKAIPSDERNRIQLVTRLLLLRSPERFVVVDLGCGRKWSEKEADIFAFEPLHQRPLHELIAGVTDVVMTHFHFDHAGGVSYIDQSGELQLSFPQASHYVQASHWDYARRPNPREKASYINSNISPLERAKLVLTEDDQEILSGIRVLKFEGHTHGYQGVVVSDGKNTAAFPSDLIPTAHHVPVVWVMGYDLCAETTVREKQAFLRRAADEQWLLVFAHDADTQAGRVRIGSRGKFELDGTVPLESYAG